MEGMWVSPRQFGHNEIQVRDTEVISDQSNTLHTQGGLGRAEGHRERGPSTGQGSQLDSHPGLSVTVLYAGMLRKGCIHDNSTEKLNDMARP